MANHHHDDHDDFGGLHRDLLATGAVIGRRRWLRMAARLGSAVGTIQLIGCSGDTPTSPSATTADRSTTTTTTTRLRREQLDVQPHPRGDGRALPRRRLERADGARAPAAWSAATSAPASAD